MNINKITSFALILLIFEFGCVASKTKKKSNKPGTNDPPAIDSGATCPENISGEENYCQTFTALPSLSPTCVNTCPNGYTGPGPAPDCLCTPPQPPPRCSNTCAHGFQTGHGYRPNCGCNPPPQIPCNNTCTYGFQSGHGYEPNCNCNPPPQIPCNNTCTHGFQSGHGYEPRCSCNPAPKNCSTTSSSGETHCQSFTQQEKQSNTPIDILWVIDNSRSMEHEQQLLAQNFATFINSFANQYQNTDFKMGIITTDSMLNRVSTLDSAFLKRDRSNFIKTFQAKIKAGVKGSGIECGLRMSLSFLQENSTWSRSNAYLFVIYISDENDRSKSPSISGGCTGIWDTRVLESENASNNMANDYLKAINVLKSSQFLKTFAIVSMTTPKNWYGRYDRGQRYIKLAELSGGNSYDIQGSFHTILQNFGEKVVEFSSSLQLKYLAVASSVEVYINGVVAPQSDWSYLPSQNAVRFEKNATPSAGSTIRITYQIK